MLKLAQMDMLKISFKSKTEVQLCSLAKGLSVSTDKALWALRALWMCGSWKAFLISRNVLLFTLLSLPQPARFFLCSVTVLPHQRGWEWDPKNLSLLDHLQFSLHSACIDNEFSCLAWRMLKVMMAFPCFFSKFIKFLLSLQTHAELLLCSPKGTKPSRFVFSILNWKACKWP